MVEGSLLAAAGAATTELVVVLVGSATHGDARCALLPYHEGHPTGAAAEMPVIRSGIFPTLTVTFRRPPAPPSASRRPGSDLREPVD